MRICHNVDKRNLVEGYVGTVTCTFKESGVKKDYYFLTHPSQTYGFCVAYDDIKTDTDGFSFKASEYGLWDAAQKCHDAFVKYAKARDDREWKMTAILPVNLKVTTVHEIADTVINPKIYEPED